MPAIDISRLQSQISNLAGLISDPSAFRKELHAVLSFYHRYAHRPAKDTVPKSFMRAYNLPDQVIKQIELGLRKTAQSHPNQVFVLICELWQDDHFEARDIAAFLLGQVPIEFADRVKQQIFDWLSQPLDRAVIEAIFTKSSQTICQQTPADWRDFIRKLLEDANPRLQNYALHAFAAGFDTLELSAIPAVFNQIRPFLQSNDPRFDDNLRKIVTVLAKISPNETVYFLKEVLSDTAGAHIESKVRTCLNAFPEEIRASLVEALKNHRRRAQ